jgi:hypothetical protein
MEYVHKIHLDKSPHGTTMLTQWMIQQEKSMNNTNLFSAFQTNHKGKKSPFDLSEARRPLNAVKLFQVPRVRLFSQLD